MNIVGNGFIARNLGPATARFAGVTVLAAGVSKSRSVSPDEFAREKELVRRVVTRCQEEGRLLVFLSTASYAMYGSTSEPATEDAAIVPAAHYGRHKRELELMVSTSLRDWLVLRLSHVVGGDQPPWHLLPNLVGQLRTGVVRVHAGAYRDLIDVSDVRASLVGLLDAGVNREIVNVASGTPYPIESIVDQIERRLRTKVARQVVHDARGPTLVSIAKLRRRLPGLAAELGGERYLNRVIERYAPRYALDGVDEDRTDSGREDSEVRHDNQLGK
ncbi:NAD-dependent epimerase/dehydratase family protein [Amycolatopsis sp. NPDC058986]|uniref:NAD-dependent epimerase/dehydratase family protein n=1 Tax=unclassified Amycolatopsis TaxID=2618356 RepID=UPI00367200B7